jgi:hypothetical protein
VISTLLPSASLAGDVGVFVKLIVTRGDLKIGSESEGETWGSRGSIVSITDAPISFARTCGIYSRALVYCARNCNTKLYSGVTLTSNCGAMGMSERDMLAATSEMVVRAWGPR